MTLLVNLFAGPGAGKSTMAARVFTALKDRGVCVEMALEFAKDLTWEQRWSAMRCQPYIFGEQLWRLQRLHDANVEVVITDSPLLLSCVYGPQTPAWHDFVRDTHLRFNSLNVFVERVKPYDPRGRRQSEDSAREVDHAVQRVLTGTFFREPIFHVTGDEAGAAGVVQQALARIGIA